MNYKCAFFNSTVSVQSAYKDYKISNIITAAMYRIIERNDTNVVKEVDNVTREIKKLKQGGDKKRPKTTVLNVGNQTKTSIEYATKSFIQTTSTTKQAKATMLSVIATPESLDSIPQNLNAYTLNTIVITISVIVILLLVSLVVYQKFFVLPTIDVVSKQSLKIPFLGVLRTTSGEKDPLIGNERKGR